MATATAIGSISKIVREELSFAKYEVEPEVDGIFTKMYTTSSGVTRGIGRSWQVIVTFATGVAGAFKNVPAAGVTTKDQALTGQVSQWDTSTFRTFPGVGAQTQPGYVQKTATLVQGMGIFSLPYTFFAAEELDASITEPIELIIRGTAKNVMQSEANHYYTNSSTIKPIFTAVTAATALTTNGAATCVFNFANTTASVGRIARLIPGMLVDGMDSSASPDEVLTNATGGVVTIVDYIGKIFTVYFSAGAVTFADGDYLIQSGSTSAATVTTGPSGAETWLKASGTVFGIDLSTHPQFKSLVAAVAGVLDEHTLDKYVGGFYDAYGGMYGLDSMITTTGVLTAYREALDGLHRYDRNNEAMKIKGGWVSMDYVYNGEPFEFLASRYQKPGQAYIQKLGQGNLRRYVPPAPKLVTKRGEFPIDIQFIAPLFGSSNIFLPAHNTSAALTEFNQAPFVCLREWCPRQLPGILLTGLTEINP